MTYLAFDLGASNGRAMTGTFDNAVLTLKEVHRFENTPIVSEGLLSWDVDTLFQNIKEGIRKAFQEPDRSPVSIGIDAWGVDIALLEKSGRLVRAPLHYRNIENTDRNMERFFAHMAQHDLYMTTGIQLLNINTVFQLFNIASNHPEWLASTKKIMMIPDLMNMWLTGQSGIERTIASTTGLLDIHKGMFDRRILEVLDINEEIFGTLHLPGSCAGTLREGIVDTHGISGTDVIRVASHDTASAVIGIPFTEQGSTFISCGTWSLIGKELSGPIVNLEAFGENFTNEGGYDGTTRFLKNISGLFILQELQKEWIAEGVWEGYDTVETIAAASDPGEASIDLDDPSLQKPGEMRARLCAHLESRNMTVPVNPGQWTRLVYESLASTYATRLRQLDRLTGTKTTVIHLVGGGANSALLARRTADITGIDVLVGPCESTVIGNIIVQAIAKGEFRSLEEARRAVKGSFPPTLFRPGD